MAVDSSTLMQFDVQVQEDTGEWVTIISYPSYSAADWFAQDILDDEPDLPIRIVARPAEEGVSYGVLY